MNPISEAQNVLVGMEVLADWLGEGGRPVPDYMANERAQSCVGCTMNRAPKWWETAKDLAAQTIRLELEARHTMKISSPFDESLGMCAACGCCMRLKIHVPISHIRDHTTPETLAKFPSHCWQRHELTS